MVCDVTAALHRQRGDAIPVAVSFDDSSVKARRDVRSEISTETIKEVAYLLGIEVKNLREIGHLRGGNECRSGIG